MIQTFSSTIRRKEMDAVLTCMVDEKIGPGELHSRFIQAVKDFTGCDGAVALRSPSIALSYALKAIGLEKGSMIMVSALAPVWQYITVEALGYKCLVLDVEETSGLLNADIVANGIKVGGRLLLLHETMGILPEMNKIMELGIPVIEDISQSVGSVYTKPDTATESNPEGEKINAGCFGVYTILGLEENDTITAGGGAVLFATGKREWTVLKSVINEAPSTDILPDINNALAFVQLKEFNRNEQARKAIFALYNQALLSSKNKTYLRALDNGSTVWSFPVVLNGGTKDAFSYTKRKEIQIQLAYEKSIIAYHVDDLSSSCIHAKSLYLRCVLFPLYPRLNSASVNKIVKVLGTLP